MSRPATPKPFQTSFPSSPTAQSGQLSYVYRWRIPRWSEIKPLVEHTSASFNADGLQWVFKIYKGRQKNPQALSLYLGIDEAHVQSMRGIRKKVRIVFILENLRTRGLDFGKMEHPVWFCEKHSTWGEENLMNLDEMGPYIDKNTVSLCVRFEVLEVHADLPEPTIGPDPASHPFARLVNNPMFSDITFRVVEDPSSPTSPSPNTATTLSPSETIVHAHKSILAASSSWFEALFTNGMRETYESEITLESVDHVVFLQLLRYCYTLQIPQIRSRREAERLLALADRFEVIPVREECLRFLRIELALNNVWSTWATADKYTSERTSTVCRQFAAAHLGELLDHPSTMNAKPQVLRMALEADEANVSGEEKIYETIVRWARYYDSAASPRGGDLDARQVDRDRDPATAFDTPSIDFGISAPPAALSSYASSELDWDVTSSEPLLRSESPTNTTAPTTSASTTVDDDMEVSSPTALSPHPGNVTLSVVPTIASSSIVLPTSPAPTLAHPPNHRRHTISSTKSPARSGTAPAPAAVTGAAPSRSPYYYRAFGHSTRHYFLPSLLACVKFPLMEKKFLVDVVERDEMVMQADGMKDLLIEAYRHHLLPEASSSISPRIKPRRKFKPAE